MNFFSESLETWTDFSQLQVHTVRLGRVPIGHEFLPLIVWTSGWKNQFQYRNFLEAFRNINLHLFIYFKFQKAKSYYCDSKGNLICQPGWKKSPTRKTPINPCPVPICTQGCVNGKCKAPNLCACDMWEGQNCTVCTPFPSCQHGHCEKPFECNCESGWIGSHCDRGKQFSTF